MARTYGRLAMSRRVMVNLTTGNAVDGILWDERGQFIVLRDATLHVQEAGGPSKLDGEVILDRTRIEFVQVIP